MHPMGIPAHRGSPGPDDIPNAFTAIFASLFNPGVAGDAVYTQEALDRVISQLMEQHTGGNAPGPAPEEAIAALPKKKVDRSMLDNKDEGDCSVCMDSVSVGSEVTNLPCGHWFHEHCVSMWLREHNTCPICRKGITPSEEEIQQQPRLSGASSSPSERPAPRSEGEGPGAGISGRLRHWFSSSDRAQE
jgi:E3 ubiquitin-protein ligase RNF115/126